MERTTSSPAPSIVTVLYGAMVQLDRAKLGDLYLD
jgi:hypothetical protein